MNVRNFSILFNSEVYKNPEIYSSTINKFINLEPVLSLVAIYKVTDLWIYYNWKTGGTPPQTFLKKFWLSPLKLLKNCYIEFNFGLSVSCWIFVLAIQCWKLSKAFKNRFNVFMQLIPPATYFFGYCILIWSVK